MKKETAWVELRGIERDTPLEGCNEDTHKTGNIFRI